MKIISDTFFFASYSLWDIGSLLGIMLIYKYYLNCFLVLVLFWFMDFDQADIVKLGLVKLVYDNNISFRGILFQLKEKKINSYG